MSALNINKQGMRAPQGVLHLSTLLKLYYYFSTPHPIVKWLWFSGLALLPISLFIDFQSHYTAFYLSLYSFFSVLVLPFIIAIPFMRTLLGYNRFCLAPGFAETSGLVLLLMCCFSSLFLPVMNNLLGLNLISSLVAPGIFITGTLFTFLMHYCMTSRHAMLLSSTLPFVLILSAIFLNKATGFLQNTAFLFYALIVSVALWIGAIKRLFVRNYFTHVNQNMDNPSTYEFTSQSASADWMFSKNNKTPASSLILAYPATLSGRVINHAMAVLISPILCASVLTLLAHGSEHQPEFFTLMQFFLLFMVALYPWAWNEYSARTRLIWLRTGGERSSIWSFLEKEMWISFSILFSFVLCIEFILVAVDQLNSSDIWALVLLALSCSIHTAYFGVLAKIRCWSSWKQAFFFSVILIIITLIIGPLKKLTDTDFTVPTLIVLLLMALWYRFLIKADFEKIDWLKVKPNIHRRKTVKA